MAHRLDYPAVRVLIAVALCAAARTAEAHDASPAGDGASAILAAVLLLAGLLYALGALSIRRPADGIRRTARRRAISFACGWLVLAAALFSRLDELGAHLFAAHMIQHELLMIVAAPLVVASRPLGTWAWALPLRWRRRAGASLKAPVWSAFWNALSDPVTAWGLHAAALWIWHVPLLFALARANEAVHFFQHASFFGSALLFWWTVLRPRRPGTALLSLFTTMIHTGALGALLVFAAIPLYPENSTGAAAWGYTALEDQQLGGLIMWIPGGFVYLACALLLSSRWLTGDVKNAGAALN
jgi:putative membrane protein